MTKVTWNRSEASLIGWLTVILFIIAVAAAGTLVAGMTSCGREPVIQCPSEEELDDMIFIK